MILNGSTEREKEIVCEVRLKGYCQIVAFKQRAKTLVKTHVELLHLCGCLLTLEMLLGAGLGKYPSV